MALKDSTAPKQAKPVAGRKTTASPRPRTPSVRTTTPLTAATATSDASSPVGTAPLRKKELVDAVVARSGIKKKDAKPAIEAALAILGEALAEGRDMNLPQFGKLKINRAKNVAGAKVTICRVRQPVGAGNSEQTAPLAKADEEG